MSHLKGSQPFSLSPDDWRKLGIGALLAIAGGFAAFLTAEALPTLQENSRNDMGNLLVAIIAAVVPILLNFLRKWGSDTRLLAIVGLAALLTLFGGTAMAEEGTYAAAYDAGAAAGGFLDGLFSDPLTMAIVLIGASLFASKILKIDLSAFILPLVTSLLKPSTTTPPTTTTTPDAPLPKLLEFLVSVLTKARAAGDKETEAAVMKILPACVECSHE